MHYRRHGDTAPADTDSPSALSAAANSKRKYSVSSLIEQRDFSGAITLIEFEREVQSKRTGGGEEAAASQRRRTEQSEALAFCRFHLGQYERALSIYLALYEEVSPDPIYRLFAACCLFHCGRFEQCIKFVEQSPANRLRNRLQLHLAFAYYNDESKMMKHIAALSDSPQDQLSLAALYFHRKKFQNATEIYKKEWMKNKTQGLAIQMFVAYCFFELDRHDTSNEIVAPYLSAFADSVIGRNLRGCNNYRLYSGKVAEQDIRGILEVLQLTNCENPCFDLIRHNLCVFRDGENALEVLPPLIGSMDEAPLNLCIHHLKAEEYVEAYQTLSRWLKKPRSAIEYTLKAIVCCCIGQIKQSDRELKMALKYFEAVGSSQSECDTIPGRQCMASFHILSKNFEDTLIYLESIKEYVQSTPGAADVFHFNYGLALSHCGRAKEAEHALLSVTNPRYKTEYVFLSHLARCYIRNGRPWESWNLYLSQSSEAVTTGGAAADGEATGPALSGSGWNLLYLIAHDCYKMGHFYYAAKAFDALEALEPTAEYWNGKRGACCGVFQAVIAGKDIKEHLLDVMQMLGGDPNPHANFMRRVMRQWCHEHGVQEY